MNYRPMVYVEGKWTGNAVVFATREEAAANARDLMMRWMLVCDARADETDAPVNYTYIDGQLKHVEVPANG